MPAPHITAENVIFVCHFFLAWLAGDKARDQITALPKDQRIAIVRQIKTVESQYRELRGRMSDLAEAMNTLLSLMQQYLGDHDTPLPVMVEAAGDEDDDEDDEDIDNLMPPLGEAEARLYQRIPDWRHGDDLIELEDEEGEDLDDGRSPGPLWFHGPGGRC